MIEVHLFVFVAGNIGPCLPSVPNNLAFIPSSANKRKQLSKPKPLFFFFMDMYLGPAVALNLKKVTVDEFALKNTFKIYRNVLLY